MLKKTMLIAGIVAVLAAVVMPAMANASARNWQHNGAGLTKTVEVVTHGTFGFSSDQGGVSCPTTAVGTLHPGSTGTISSFNASDTSKCTYSGSLDTLCGTVTIHTSTTTGEETHISKAHPWVTHATKFPDGQYGFTITGFETHLDGTGVFCPNVTWHGEVVAKGDPHAGSTFTLSGTLTSNITNLIHISGIQHLTPAGTYKIAT